MRAVLQRVTNARVEIDGEVAGEIGPGLVVLLGVTHGDTVAEGTWLADKIVGLRIMAGERSVAEIGGSVLVISQFTVYGDARKGRRPTWQDAAPGPVSEPLYDAFCDRIAASGVPVATGRFGADMAVTLTNDGPVTLVLDRDSGGRGSPLTPEVT